MVAAQTLSNLSSSLAVVTTFESAGLYLDKNLGDCDPDCPTATVQYRPSGTTEWLDAHDMVYGPGGWEGEYRSSIVMLAPDTAYQARVTVAGEVHEQEFRTWPETANWPIGKVTVPTSGPVSVTESGTPEGYHLVDGSDLTVTGDSNCVRVKASYVIVRGITCVDQSYTPVFVQDGVTDVLIERLDISGFTGSGKGAITIGANDDYTETYRIVIQRNHIHDPGWGIPDTEWGSEAPYGIMVREEHGGNHVFRYNTVTASKEHMWRDAFGGFRNTSEWGYPGKDSDIYGNYISHCGDDCIETEGGGSNVRVWHNYMHEYGVGIAVAGLARGPVYIFRNTVGAANGLARRETDRSGHIKTGTGALSRCDDCVDDRYGRHYSYHNTFVNIEGADGSEATQSNSWGQGPKAQTSANNIYQVRAGFSALDANTCFYDDQTNEYSHELYWDGKSINGCHAISNLIRGKPQWERHTPIVQPGEPWYGHLEAGTPGYNAGRYIPNFSDGYRGTAPDIGAHESGADPMCFGHTCIVDIEEPMEFDYGDAPDGTSMPPNTYPTLAVNNGASHTAAGIMLGGARDTETDGQPTDMADGDDTDGTGDEDGVSFGALTVGNSAQVTVTVSAAGRLDAWIDFNADGDWNDTGEQVFASQSLFTGANYLTVPVPDNASTGSTFARFRVSSSGGLKPNGPAADGEVEDYRVLIDGGDLDTDGDGIPDSYETANGLDPYSNDANGDLDGDGLTNLEEYHLGTEADNPDTDGDGIADAQDDDPTLFSNLCDQDSVVLADLLVSSGQSLQCSAKTRIQAQIGVRIESGGRLELRSPTVTFDQGFSVPTGAELEVSSRDSIQ